MSSTSQKRKKIQKKFKNRGYNLKFDALDEILVFADQFPDDDDGEAIDLLLDNLQETRMPPNSFLSRIILRNLTSILKSLGIL
jgi:DNA polymerase epsilon subunit 2